MNELMLFENSEFGTIRTFMINGEIWFVGKDVAVALGYSNTKDALASHVDDEDKRVIQRSGNTTLEIPNRGLTIINESGLYSLVLSSKLDSAKGFKHWITHDVIPSIRETGSYSMPQHQITEYDRKLLEVRDREAKVNTAQCVMKLWDAAGVQAADQALALNGYFDGIVLPREALKPLCVHMLDATTIASNLGIMSKTGNPHTKAVAAIIGTLELDEDEYAYTPYSRNGHDGVSIQYSDSVEAKVKDWLETNKYPTSISINGKSFTVAYKSKE